MNASNKKSVVVVMSTYNGEKYISEQIDSILAQIDVNVNLFIRDDGSTDNTCAIIEKYATKHSNVECELSSNVGFAKSFFYALQSIHKEYDYYAFADQDDVWDKDKLIDAILKLENEDKELKLYASGLRIVDAELNFQYNHLFDAIRINYGSALSRQRLAGCTMVFNNKLKQKVCLFELGDNTVGFLSHDALVYYTCLLCGGSVVFCPEGKIQYRRHVGTVTENGKGIAKKIYSVLDVFTTRKSLRYNQTIRLYEAYKDDICESNFELINKIIAYKGSIHGTIALLFDSNLNCGIISADIINKIAIVMRCY